MGYLIPEGPFSHVATGRTGEEVPKALRAQNVLVIATVVCGLASTAARVSAEDRVIDTQYLQEALRRLGTAP